MAPGDGGLRQRAYMASVRELDIERIHVPRRFHPSIAETGEKSPSFLATVAWGKRYEPWVVAVE